jgi:pimeloyl-ACP methyl ester carboxylesterase
MRPVRSVTVVAIVTAMLAGCAAPQPTWTPLPASSPSEAASAGPSSEPAPSAAPSVEPSPSPSPSPTPAERPFAGGWTHVKTEPCPDESTFECITLAVPRDHFVLGGPAWDVTFARRAASGQRIGTYVTITGGPGSSGIAVADSYTDDYNPTVISERYDTIFLDQRGIGLSHPIQCPDASAAYYLASADPFTPDGAKAAGAAARSYVDACIAEAGADEGDLPYYASRQAVEDLEALLDYLDEDRVVLYGESYGTQYVQSFAASHPERVQSLIIDGPVDLTLNGPDFLAEQARAFDDVLISTLAACGADDACAADHGAATPLAAYDALAERLAGGPLDFTFHLANGSAEARQITQAVLDNALGFLYGPSDRVFLERALAAAANDDLVPLARLAYAYLVLDPETEEAIPDPTWSDAMYYAVECQDYAYFADAGDADARSAAYIAAGVAQGMDLLRLGSFYTGDLPCAYWPNASTGSGRPDPIVSASYPTLVLGATADPATPVANVYRIAARLTDAYTIVTEGGDHVIFGRGNACPDDIVADYLVKGKRPESRSTVCDGAVVDDYVAIARPAPTDYPDALSLMSSMDDQVTNTVDYWEWDAEDPLAMGCDFGGTLTYTPTDTGSDLALAACEFTDGLSMTGTGAIDDETGGLTLKVEIPDGSLDYARDGDGNQSVSGTFRGSPVDQEG